MQNEMDQISIVVQGPLFTGNLVECANFLAHWRFLFPVAEIIFSISSSDLIDLHRFNSVGHFSLSDSHTNNSIAQSAADIIRRSCDAICLAEAALPLPPIKSTISSPNNVNLQISAAQAGLKLAKNKYCLRIRNDMCFLNKNFISQYSEKNRHPRLSTATLKERVLISWMFTVNPYTVVRFPLHFSDWLNFGLTCDVAEMWNIPQMSLSNSIYFSCHQHAANSFEAEKTYSTRLATEQHIYYNYFCGKIPGLSIEHLNDSSSADVAMDVMLDNFIICDLKEAGFYFPKYRDEMKDPTQELVCITPSDFNNLLEFRGREYRSIFAKKISLAESLRGELASDGSSRTYPAETLCTEIGVLKEGTMFVDSQQSGTLLFGPYISLTRGEYSVTAKVESIPLSGIMELIVTADSGARTLAEKKINLGGACDNDFTAMFRVVDDRVANVEAVCRVSAAEGFGISSVTFSRCSISEV
ncbi:WavE lipopolysaccharide synthesis [Methylobacterium sp. 190mf]|uniref:WavE lipopolysaccharide synthesis family protein n=1 Tax=Methylobacterium sp. 190mf TaxID=1761798 RepID=UPI00089E5FCF|nr:WavE lipopolysaccharide synthesis family protein [Methylobacterium sp. 190mf]SEG73300.1 WavE lipopolysaccharide synthesis [Methylobacterium sp. 190mf]